MNYTRNIRPHYFTIMSFGAIISALKFRQLSVWLVTRNPKNKNTIEKKNHQRLSAKKACQEWFKRAKNADTSFSTNDYRAWVMDGMTTQHQLPNFLKITRIAHMVDWSKKIATWNTRDLEQCSMDRKRHLWTRRTSAEWALKLCPVERAPRRRAACAAPAHKEPRLRIGLPNPSFLRIEWTPKS